MRCPHVLIGSALRRSRARWASVLVASLLVTLGSAGVARADASSTDPQTAPKLWCTATSSVSAGMGTGYAVAWVPAGASASFTAKDIEILPSIYIGNGRGEFTYRVTLSGSGGAQLWTDWGLAGSGISWGGGPYAWVPVGSTHITTWVNTTGASVQVLVKADANPTYAGADTRYTLQVDVTGGASDPAPGCSNSGALTVSNAGVAPNPRMSLNQCASGKPISCATGDFWHTFGDLSVPGRGPALNLQRTYNAFAHGSDSMFGYGWSNSYGMTAATDVAGNVTLSQENGSTITFAPDGAGGFTAPALVQASLVKNADGTLTLTDSHGGMTHTFAAAGRLLAEGDRNGMTTTLGYDSGNRLTTVTDAAGRTLTFGYGSDGRVSTATDPAGRALSYSYDGSGNLVSATNLNGGVWAFTYDSAHQLLTMTDPRGGVVASNTYDSAGRVTAQTDALNRTTTLAYSGDPVSAAGSTTTVTDPRGTVTTQAYSQLQLTSITRAFGTPQAATTTYSYDPATNAVASKTDPNGQTTSYTWDSRGNPTSSTDPLGRTTSTSWTALNQPASITDPAGHSTTFGYDTRGNVVAQNRAVNATTTQSTTFTHGDAAHPGDITSMTDPTGKTWTMVYDANGDLTKATDPLGDATTYGYDGTGRATSMISPRGNATGANPAAFTTAYTYDPAGALTRRTDPLGHATNYGYDADGNRTTITDPLGHVSTTTFDAESQPTKVTRADGTTLTYGYDAGGNQTSQSNAKTNTTSYTYDPLGRVSSTRDPLGRATTFGYDAAGQLTTKTDPAGRVTTFGYDAGGQRSTLSYSDAATAGVTYTYTTLGQRATMSDGAGTTTYTYDWLGRLTAQTNGAGQATSYAYDLAGHLTTLTYPNAKAVTRGYDDAGRLHTVTDWLGHTTTLTPDPDSNPASVVSGNGVTATATFDNADQLATITDTAAGSNVASFGYTRNANGQLASTTATGVPGGNESYPYTQLNQLAGVNTTTYVRDAADNLTKLINGTTQTFDAANQLTATTTAGVSTSYTNDGVGARTGSQASTGAQVGYAYDQAGRLTTATITTPGSGHAVFAGANHTLAIKPGGTLAAWGANGNGRLGDGTTTARSTPITVAALTSVVTAAAGTTHSLAVKSDGTVWAWGGNASGELGDGTITDRLSPVRSGTLSGVRALAAGNEFSLALMTDGTVKAWGLNTWGQLGNGTTTTSRTPVTVSGLSSVVAIAAAGTHGVALKSDGTVWAWGRNNNGQLGDATTTNRKTPVRSGTLGAVTAISTPANGQDTIALKSDGTVWAWGTNGSGQLGDGTTTTRTSPVQVAGLTGAVAIAAGASHTLAVKTGGGLWAWGTNASGQLGQPATITGSKTPLLVASFTLAGDVTAGTDHTVAVKTDGTLWAWGAGTSGQLGNGTKISNNTPVRVTGLTLSTPTTTSSSYTYNGDGLRATRTTTAGVQKFAFDPTGGVPLLLTDGAVNYLYDDNGNPLEQIDAAGVALYYQHDQYGSTRLLTNQAGAAAATFSYDPYGNLTGRTGTADTPLRWNGQYQDTDTGLYYLRARYYDPVTAQFLTRDPLEALTLDAYGYAGNDPMNTADPSGLCGPACVFLVGAAIGGGVNLGLQMLGNASQGCGLFNNINWGEVAGSALAGGVASVGGSWVAGAAETADGAVAFGPGTAKAWSVFDRVASEGSPLPGYKGGSVFKNLEGRLPGADGARNPVSYREWDVNPYVKGVDRGPERLVTGSDGSAYFTGDHYGSFLQFWGVR